MIKLIFLGTKGEIEESSKKHKYHSSLMLQYKKFKLLIDYGTLQKNKLEKIKPNAILVTHAHPDHYVWTKENVETKIPVYLTKKTFDYGKFKPENYKIIKLNKKFKLGSFTIIPHKVLHSIRCPGVAFEIFAERKKIIYTGDVVDIVSKNNILKKADCYIGDGSSIRANLVRRRDNKIFGHARIITQVNWCKKCDVKNIIFTHFGKESIRKEKEFKKKYPEIIFAYDGMDMRI